MMDSLLYSLSAGPVATNVYLILHPESGTAVCIDAPAGCFAWVKQHLDDHACKLTELLLTHTHWDHTADAAPLVKATGAEVYVHAADLYRLTDPMNHTIWPLPFEIEPVAADHFLNDGDVLQLKGATFEVLHTPGHTEGGVCFVDHVRHKVYAGDTLFAGSIGRTDLPGGDAELLLKSIADRLFTLPGDYVVLPGHGPTTTIGEERVTNPFVGENANEN